VLLRPHRSYARVLLPLIGSGQVHALSHITGGGIPENLVRVLPENVHAFIDRTSWHVPTEFNAVQQHGRVEEHEMFLTFNMGVGIIAVVADNEAAAIIESLERAGERAWRIGHLAAGERGVSIQ